MTALPREGVILGLALLWVKCSVDCDSHWLVDKDAHRRTDIDKLNINKMTKISDMRHIVIRLRLKRLIHQ